MEGDNDNVLAEFINSHLSVADNIYHCFLEFLTLLLKSEKLYTIDKSIFDKLFELLSALAYNPPVESQLECRISLSNTLDMKKYWHIFKLVKGNLPQLEQYIEKEDFN